MNSCDHFQLPFHPSPHSAKYFHNHSPNESPTFFMDIADMDFQIDPAIRQDYLQRMTSVKDFTYKCFDPEVKEYIKKWYHRRRKVEIEVQWIMDSPSLPQSLNLTLLSCTNQGDGVLVFTPTYYFFLNCITILNRECIYSQLLIKDNRFCFDLQDIKSKLPRCKLVVLCNPMNPTGQVFTREELTPLVDLMNNYGRERKVILWCDEILADMAYEGFESSLGLGYERLVVADSPSKAFNVSSEMPGYTIIRNQELRANYEKWRRLMRIALTDSTMRLIQSCYTTAIGESWLKKSIEKFKKNYEFMSSFCKEHMSKLILSKPESGYCVVIDFKNYVTHDKEIIEIMDTAALAAKKLDSYYEPGKKDVTQVRICIACPLQTLRKMLESLKIAIHQEVQKSSDSDQV